MRGRCGGLAIALERPGTIFGAGAPARSLAKKDEIGQERLVDLMCKYTYIYIHIHVYIYIYIYIYT